MGSASERDHRRLESSHRRAAGCAVAESAARRMVSEVLIFKTLSIKREREVAALPFSPVTREFDSLFCRERPRLQALISI